MKKIIHSIALPFLFFVSQSANCQQYKTVEDTLKLQKEYLDVSTDIAGINQKLSDAQENLKKDQSKVVHKDSDAQTSAESSSNQASKATNGTVKDARKAKRKAKAAYTDAKQARSANETMISEEKKIKKLSNELQKKQERLQELDTMRTAINKLVHPA